MVTNVTTKGFDTMTDSKPQRKPVLMSITAPLPGWVRLRKIDDPSKTIDIDPTNEMHRVIHKNFLRSGYWEEIPAPAEP